MKCMSAAVRSKPGRRRWEIITTDSHELRRTDPGANAGLCAVGFLFAATHYVLAAVYRRPDVSFVFALNLGRLFYHPEFYSGSGSRRV